MEHIAQGKRSDTLGLPYSRVYAPCKGKSFNPLCCYSYLIADLAVLKWNIVCVFCSTPAPCLKAFALTGRDCSNTRYPGCRFACPGLCAPLGLQPVLLKLWTSVKLVNGVDVASPAASTQNEEYGQPMGHRTEEHKYVPHTVVVGTAVVGKKVGARGVEKSLSAKTYHGWR